MERPTHFSSPAVNVSSSQPRRSMTEVDLRLQEVPVRRYGHCWFAKLKQVDLGSIGASLSQNGTATTAPYGGDRDARAMYVHLHLIQVRTGKTSSCSVQSGAGRGG